MTADPGILFVSDPDHPLHGEFLLVKDILKRHMTLGRDLASSYRKRSEEPAALQRAIDLCHLQIAMSEEAATAFRWDHDRWQRTLRALGGRPARPFALPRHRGFDVLAAIREEEGNTAEALSLLRRAQQGGWFGDYARRIARISDESP